MAAEGGTQASMAPRSSSPSRLVEALPERRASWRDRQIVLPEWCHSSEVPVRRTFIDYRCPDDSPRQSPSRSLSGLSTAPASLAGSVRESLDEAVPSAMYRPAKTITTSTTRWAELSDSVNEDEEFLSSGDEEEEDLGLCPIYSEGAALPSVGSAGHGDGTCRRCCFFPKGRCNNGQDCQFCHFAHEKRKGKNKKKKHKKRSGRGRGRQAHEALVDSSPTRGVLGPVPIDLQQAIPAEEAVPAQARSSGFTVPGEYAFVSVPFCVGVY